MSGSGGGRGVAQARAAEAKLVEAFGPSDQPLVRVFAPGRVNLIGEHTDYMDGCVLPIALEQVTVVVGRRRQCDGGGRGGGGGGGGGCRVVTCAAEEKEKRIVEFDLPTYPPPRTEQERIPTSGPHWSSYVQGVVALMNKHGNIPPFDLAVATNVPIGSGLSSSASLEVAVGKFVEELCRSRHASEGEGREHGMSGKELARVCQEAEHRFAGVPCGAMDQMVSVLAKEGHALFLDCSNLSTRDVPLDDPDSAILVIDSGYKHELVSGEYENRKNTAESAARKLGRSSGKLRGVTLSELQAHRGELSDEEYRRARHVVSEIQRTDEAVQALEKRDLLSFGKLMNDSHKSLDEDFDVSCGELNQLVSLAQQDPDVYGSRMTGGGFGGCTVTLLKKLAIERVTEHIKKHYRPHSKGKNTSFIVAVPSSGAGVIKHIN